MKNEEKSRNTIIFFDPESQYKMKVISAKKSIVLAKKIGKVVENNQKMERN